MRNPSFAQKRIIALSSIVLAGCSSSNYSVSPLRPNPDPFEPSRHECIAYSKEEFGKRSYAQGYIYCMAKKGWKIAPNT